MAILMESSTKPSQDQETKADNQQAEGLPNQTGKNANDPKKATPKLGRKGDPRMHKAVAARLANPEMSLLDALRIGGFEFPDGATNGTVNDSDNVPLCQRKNQLSRRLRLAKQSIAEKSGGGGKGFKELRGPPGLLPPGLKESPIGMSRGTSDQTLLHTNRKSQGLSRRAQEELGRLLNHSERAHDSISETPQLGQFSQARKKRTASVLSVSGDDHNDKDNLVEDDEDMAGDMANLDHRIAKRHPLYGSMKPGEGALNHHGPTGIGTGMYGFPQMTNTWPNGSGLMSEGGIPPPMPQPSTDFTRTETSNTITALQATASSMGISLEQLAVFISDSDLDPAIQQQQQQQQQQQEEAEREKERAARDEQKMKMALDFYRAESASLFKRCMIMAGYEADHTNEGASQYLQFVRRAWQSEGHRIAQLHKMFMGESFNNIGVSLGDLPGTSGMTRVVPQSAPMHSHSGPCLNIPTNITIQHNVANQQGNDTDMESTGVVGDTMDEGLDDSAGGDKSHGDCDDDHHHHHEGMQQINGEGCSTKTCGRHIHLLEGKCGHKAIIHQPPNGMAHVDFVVDGKVECYEGIPAGRNAQWTSRYHCDELGEPCNHVLDAVITNGKKRCTHDCGELKPKIIDLSGIDLSGNEWNVDNLGHGPLDETLLGLIRLGGGNDQQL